MPPNPTPIPNLSLLVLVFCFTALALVDPFSLIISTFRTSKVVKDYEEHATKMKGLVKVALAWDRVHEGGFLGPRNKGKGLGLYCGLFSVGGWV